MRETRHIMGMNITLAVMDDAARPEQLDAVFQEFSQVDEQFSPFKPDSEVCRLNRGAAEAPSARMREILDLSEQTRLETAGYFNIVRPDGGLDPSGLVKGWAIRNAAQQLAAMGFADFCVEAGGDVQPHGRNAAGAEWRVGIASPMDPEKIVKTLYPKGCGVATSGVYAQGRHIYDPHTGEYCGGDIVSLTVIGPDVLEADRFATAAFAMGRRGIGFIESRPGFEGYEIDACGMARMTSGLERYLSC